jgi:hypothetical protein
MYTHSRPCHPVRTPAHNQHPALLLSCGCRPTNSAFDSPRRIQTHATGHLLRTFYCSAAVIPWGHNLHNVSTHDQGLYTEISIQHTHTHTKGHIHSLHTSTRPPPSCQKAQPLSAPNMRKTERTIACWEHEQLQNVLYPR